MSDNNQPSNVDYTGRRFYTLDDVLGMTAKDIIALGEDYNPSDFDDDALSAIQLAWELIHEARGDYNDIYTNPNS